jgi:hypothetical protein
MAGFVSVCYTNIMDASSFAQATRSRIHTTKTVRGLAAYLLPALLTLLLLALPIVCIVHCRLAMQQAHHPQPSASNPVSFFLCEHPIPTTAHTLFPPAFLPGVLPLLVGFTIILGLLRSLQLPVQVQWTTLHRVPPTPPPR